MSLTVRDAARLLACSERQLYRWIDEGGIPFQRVRDQVRFNRTDLLEWATVRRLPISLEAFDALLDVEDQPPSLAEALCLGGVHYDVPGADRNSVLRAVVERTPMPAGLDRDFVIDVLTARENTVSTAVGDGIAIPHVRQPVVAAGASLTVSVSYLEQPVSFGAPDRKPVQVILFMISPTIRAHLQMLAHVARAILDPRCRAALDRKAPLEDLVGEVRRLEAAPLAKIAAEHDGGSD